MTPIYGGYGLSKATTHAPTYNLWCNIKARCLNPNNPSWARYGGQGIGFHQPWCDNYENFWLDVGMRPSAAHSFDRIESSGHYEPGNVQWSTMLEQQNNRSNNIRLRVDDEWLTLSEAARHYGIKYHTFRWRYLKYGNNLEQLLALPMSPAVAGRLGSDKTWNKGQR